MEHLLPTDLVINELGKRHTHAHMSTVASPKKTGRKIGVNLRFYKYDEFAALADD